MLSNKANVTDTEMLMLLYMEAFRICYSNFLKQVIAALAIVIDQIKTLITFLLKKSKLVS